MGDSDAVLKRIFFYDFSSLCHGLLVFINTRDIPCATACEHHLGQWVRPTTDVKHIHIRLDGAVFIFFLIFLADESVIEPRDFFVLIRPVICKFPETIRCFFYEENRNFIKDVFFAGSLFHTLSLEEGAGWFLISKMYALSWYLRYCLIVIRLPLLCRVFS